MTNNIKEVETRAVFDNKDSAVKWLIQSGFTETQEFLQHDIIFDKNNWELFKSGQKVRIRIEKGTAELTFKGVFKGDDSVWRRKEINVSFPVSEVETYVDLLKGLGYNMLFQLKKQRTVFMDSIQWVEAVIDEYPLIGFLVELEGPEENITKIAETTFPDKAFKNYRLKELYQQHVEKAWRPLDDLLIDFQKSPIWYDLWNIQLILR